MEKSQKTSNYPAPSPWSLKGVIPLTGPADESLELALGAPPAALSWLRAGFSAGVRRRQPWLLDGLDSPDQAAARWAARYFRRGVPVLSLGAIDDGHWRGCDEGASALSLQCVDGVPAAIYLARQTGRHVFLVIDEAVAQAWPVFDAGVEGGSAWVFRGGESAKTLESAAAICRELRAQVGSAAREDVVVVAVGGGVVLDLAGFVAALFSLTHINIPTTLLGMVDASIGGKTGVNFAPWGKNQVGSFHFPESVILCPEFLTTLPREEILAGGAECIKHAFIAGDWDMAARWAEVLGRGEVPDSGLIRSAIALKDRVVQADPYELIGSAANDGLVISREYLNLGHTIGHALESWSMDKLNVTLRHGAAVAFGLLCKSKLLCQMDPASSAFAEKMAAILFQSGCLQEISSWFVRCLGEPTDQKVAGLWQELLPLIMQDKKLAAGGMGTNAPVPIRVAGFCASEGTMAGSFPAVGMLDVSEESLRKAFKDSLKVLLQRF